jgi:glycosyltransferase involved in cell wall biosynthesis
MKKNILIISYDFTPINSPNTYRWKEIAEFLTRNGHNVYVLTCKSKNRSNIETINAVNIIRSGYFTFNNLRNLNNKNHTSYNNDKKSFFKFILHTIHNLTWKKIYWPDFAILWALTSLKSAKNITKKFQIEKIITVCRPFSSNIIGHYVKSEFKNIEWQIDYIDPFSFSMPQVNNNLIYRNINKKFEKFILNNANIVSVLNEQIRDKLINLHSNFQNKFIIAPNIFQTNITPSDFQKVNIEKDLKNIIYCGSINGEIRNPLYFFKLFKLINQLDPNVKLHVYGEISNCNNILKEFKDLIGISIYFHGQVNRETAIKKCLEAKALLNLGNNNIFQEPSKIIEYMSFFKPILNICLVHNDASVRILDNYNASLSLILNEEKLITRQIVNEVLYFLNKEHKFKKEIINNLLEERNVSKIALKYL